MGDVSPGCDVMGWPFGGLSLKPHDPDAVMRRASGEAERRDTLQAPGQCVSELPRSPHVRPLADWRRLAGLRGREGHSHWGSWTGQEAKRGPAARSAAPVPGGAPRGVIGRIRRVGLTGALSHAELPMRRVGTVHADQVAFLGGRRLSANVCSQTTRECQLRKTHRRVITNACDDSFTMVCVSMCTCVCMSVSACVHMCVPVCTRMRVCLCTHACACAHCVCMHVMCGHRVCMCALCACARVSVRVRACAHRVCMHAVHGHHVCMRVHCVHVHVCLCVCAHVCMYVHAHVCACVHIVCVSVCIACVF